MEQFSLEKYLETPSRKVITRDGRVVKILDTEFESGNGNKSVLAKCIYNNKAAVYVYTTDGKANNIGETENDLFFADEKERLNEFERELEMMMVSFSNGNLGSDVIKEMPKQKLHDYAHRLLDFARKENLKDLPKWKKCDDNLPYSHIGGLNERYLIKDGYCIKISDLETLPKEE